MPKSLPPRPHLENLKKRAKLILKGQQSRDQEILKEIQEHHPRWRGFSAQEIQSARFTLADAQLVIARQYGFDSWAKLKGEVLLREDTPSGEIVKRLRDAAGRGDLDQLNALLDAHLDLINEPGGQGVRTALHQAVFGNHEAAVKLLLDRGADPNIRCEGDNAMPLHFALEKSLFPIVRLLIEHGADPIGEGDYHELGVIGWATAWDYVQADKEIVDYLLAHGARHNLWSAVAMGDVQAIRELAAKGADLERRMDLTNRRRRPLHLAVAKKQVRSLTTLLELGADMESIDEARFTALDQAALGVENEMVQILLDRGAKVRLPSAFALNRTKDIQNLLRKDPDTLKRGGRWEYLIVRASEQSPVSVIDALIAAGAEVNIFDGVKTAVDNTSGFTPLHAAAWHNNISAAKALLKHGANVRIREHRWHGTPAGWAAYAGHTEMRDLIKQQPVDIMEAIDFGLTERVLAIVDEDPEALNRPFSSYALYPLYAEGWYTPLAFAVIQKQAGIVNALLKRGADASTRGPDGRSLYELAREKGHEEIAATIKEHEARWRS
jgi:ankyrin repeat protein